LGDPPLIDVAKIGNDDVAEALLGVGAGGEPGDIAILPCRRSVDLAD
jgi:hypothetical protein